MALVCNVDGCSSPSVGSSGKCEKHWLAPLGLDPEVVRCSNSGCKEAREEANKEIEKFMRELANSENTNQRYREQFEKKREETRDLVAEIARLKEELVTAREWSRRDAALLGGLRTRDVSQSAVENLKAPLGAQVDKAQEAQKDAERFALEAQDLRVENLRLETDLRVQQKREPNRVDRLRKAGWSVAAHYDYRLAGAFHTVWIFAWGGRVVKGEGTSDAEALHQILVAAGVRHDL